MDTLQLYRQALMLAQHGNYARAAEALGIAQPNLTRAIAVLERSLSVRLFERGRSGATATAFGRVFFERAEVVLRTDGELRRELQLLAALATGTLTLACGPYAAETAVAESVARLIAANPKLRVECTVTDPEHSIAEVLAGRVDVGVGSGARIEREAELVVEHFAPLRVHLACRPGHPLTREPRLTIARALEYPLVATRLRGVDALQLMPGFVPAAAAHGAVPEMVPPIVVNSLAMARRIAGSSDALAGGFAAQLADDVRAGRLVLLDIDDATLRNSHAAYHRRDRPLAPAALAFLAHLREVEQELQQAEAPSRDRRRSA